LSLQVRTIQAAYCFLGLGFGGHLDESESSWFAAEFVRDDLCGCDLPIRFKSLPQVIFGYCT
jgi:hypothetical protein